MVVVVCVCVCVCVLCVQLYRVFARVHMWGCG